MPTKRRRTTDLCNSGLASATVTDTPSESMPCDNTVQHSRSAPCAGASTTDRQIAGRIVKLLERCCAAGRRQDEVYSDWLQFVATLLDQEEPNLIALATTGRYADDPPAVSALLQRLGHTYPYREGAKVQYLDYFLQAYAELRISPGYGYMDVVGTAFMLFGHPSKWAGQFFTPSSVSLAMAQLCVPDGPALVDERLKAAIAKSPAASAALLAGVTLDGEVARAWFIARVIPLAVEHFEPIRVLDPACGSSIMLISASAMFPQWACALGLVQFFGQDIDPDAVLMSKINLKLYGLNGHALRRTIMEAETILREHGVDANSSVEQADPPVPVQHVLVFPAPTISPTNTEAMAAA